MGVASTLYVANSTIISLLPPGYDPNEFTATRIEEIADEASRWVDANLREFFVAFNGTTDTPATPGPIQALARKKARLIAWESIKPASRNTLVQADLDFDYEQLERDLKKIRAGEIILGEEIVATQTLTWGTGEGGYTSTNYATNWAELGGTGTQVDAAGNDPVRIIKTSVQVLTPTTLRGYQRGRDFDVYFDGPRRKTFLIDGAGRLGQQTSTVSFRWTYERQTDETTPGRRRSSRWESV